MLPLARGRQAARLLFGGAQRNFLESDAAAAGVDLCRPEG